MPQFTLYTNVEASKVPPAFVTDTAELISKLLGKPTQYVIVNIVPDHKLLYVHGGMDDPCAYGTLGNIGAVNGGKIAGPLTDHICKGLGIATGKIAINIANFTAPNYIYGGSTIG